MLPGNKIAKKPCLILLVVFLLLPSIALAAGAGQQVEIFALKHRSATEVIGRVEPLLKDSERISAAENHLVVIASPQTLQAVKKLLSVIDRPRHQYLVRARWVKAPAIGNGRLGYDAATRQATLPPGGTLSGTNLRLSGQQLLVIEGEEAFVVTGRDVPYSSNWSVWSGRFSSGFSGRVAFQRIRSGFVVRVDPLEDGRLAVDIMPQLMAAEAANGSSPAVIQLDRLETHLRIMPGEWTGLSTRLPETGLATRILAGGVDGLSGGQLLQLRIDEQN